jgi:hypothetical protein
MNRTVASFCRMKVAWQAMADEVITKPNCTCSSSTSEEQCIHQHSRLAYAVKQVEMYTRFENDATLKQKLATAKKDIFDKFLVL